VLVALAMGAAKVIALGRDKDVLSQIQAIDSKRVVAVVLEGVAVSRSSRRNLSPLRHAK
jgi:hypothetical protein